MKTDNDKEMEENFEQRASDLPDQSTPWKPPEWEYHRLKTPDRAPVTASVLNEQGRLGWELVSVLHVGGEINYIFKRMK